MDVTLIAVATVWGAVAGVLVPRAAYRLSVEPEDDWRADCPAGHPIGGPLRGWVGAARCTSCAAGVPAVVGAPRAQPDTGGRPPVTYRPSVLVPVVTALVCLAVAASTGPRPELAVWLLFTPAGVLLALVDRNVHRLPDQLTLPLAAASAALLGLAELLPHEAGSWPAALLGGLVLGAVYFLLFLINPDGMGFGDVKLALALGVVLGWYGWVVLFMGAFAGFLLGSLYGLTLMLLRRAGRKTAIPFGPFMICGALLGVLLGALGTS
ncbi:prepilin peptidase [Streptomyces sp. ISL-10]|uniref:prepilin peptidase n=1 Tax=Streptomyces sp. ISL-10 TaxID=2819172 RepID=UPI001BE8F147|nr:A24 family peptidase [Streptomyces sp. ISL-10]MBT2365090.1 prepilin peptidase [Streptomyces sp. ISL-10]